MTTATVTQPREELKAARRPLQQLCKKFHITHDMIAAEARCTRSYVVLYFSGHRSPRAVELAAEKLIGLARSNGRKARR